MAYEGSIENVRSTVYVGGQISGQLLRWAGLKSFEAMLFGATQTANAAERGMRIAKQSAKIIAKTAEQQMPATSIEIVKKQAHDTWLEKVQSVQGIIETSHSPDTITAAKAVQASAALTYADICREHGIALGYQDWQALVGQAIAGGTPMERLEPIVKELMPAGQMISDQPGLESYIGSFDPSVPRLVVVQDSEEALAQLRPQTSFDRPSIEY